MPNPAVMRTLLIVDNARMASAHGCSPVTRNHRSSPEVRFWWPDCRVEDLRGCRFDMVVEACLNLPAGDRATIKARHTNGHTLWIDGTLR